MTVFYITKTVLLQFGSCRAGIKATPRQQLAAHFRQRNYFENVELDRIRLVPVYAVAAQSMRILDPAKIALILAN